MNNDNPQPIQSGQIGMLLAQIEALPSGEQRRLYAVLGALLGDPNWPLMLALEIWDDEEGQATKADIFFKRTVGEVELPARVETAKDAMLLSLSIYGQIVLKDMALRTGKPVMEVVNELKAHGTAYRDPILARWVPADEYLSGHIRDKIEQAKAAGPAYEANVTALEAVLPKDLGPAEVEARLGAPWIPTDVIEDFAKELVNDTRNSVSVGYDSTTATWSIKSSGNMQWVGDHTLQRTKWGTDKRCALQLVEAALNQQPPTVTMMIDGKSVVDAQATLSAREKWQAIRDHFRSWVYRDDARRDRLLRLYNDTFNQVVPRRFDGSHLQLPGMAKIRNRQVKPEEDNMLAVTNDGRRAAIDVRMVNPSMPFDPNGKLAKVAGNVHRIWKEGAQRRVTQLVFSDLGTPGASGLSVYEEVKRLLVEQGIPEAEIEFIQDHASDSAKAKLFKRVRDGAVRVLFGSTPMLGTGTNVQNRLKAIHQIDAPWRPSDVEQRDGRADRQGNECESIELWRYVTEASFDSYSWNLLDVKARFIDQVMTAEQGLRTVEDISMTALSYAEIKAIASGNPLVLEKAQVDAAVQKLSLKFDHYEQDRWKMGRRKADLQRRLKWLNDNMQLAEGVAREAAAITTAMAFKPLLATAAAAMAVENNNCLAIGQALKAVNKVMGGDARIAQLGNFVLETSRWGGTVDLVLVEQTLGARVRVERPPMHELIGVGAATYEAFKGFVSLPADLRGEYGQKTEELAGIQAMLEQDFEFREELEAARMRQREIEAELDLDKATAGTSAMETEAA